MIFHGTDTHTLYIQAQVDTHTLYIQAQVDTYTLYIQAQVACLRQYTYTSRSHTLLTVTVVSCMQ